MKAEVAYSKGSITSGKYAVLRVETGRSSQGRRYITLSMPCSAYEEDPEAAERDLRAIADAINRP